MQRILFSPPDIRSEDIDKVVQILKDGWITTGSKTKLFEKEIAKYCYAQKAVCLNSATAGMELILRVLGIGPGDEVITSAYTYTASASVICHVGATPVLVDVKKDTYHCDTEQIKKAITSKTKAIIAVDMAGIMCDYDEIFQIVDTYSNIFKPQSELQQKLGRIAVIADAAHSLGAKYKGRMSGQVADFTSFSFHAVKNLTTGEGGAITWKDNDIWDHEMLYKTFSLLSLHGQSKDALAKSKPGAWEYDIEIIGYKCNMTDIMAALGLSQLIRYEEIIQTRQRLVDLYNEAIRDLNIKVIKHEVGENRSSFHLYLTAIEGISETQRNWVIEQLAIAGIATNVHYKPLPMHTGYKKMGFKIEDYPNSYEMYKKEITLPLYTLLKEEEIVIIVEKLKEVLLNLPE